MLAALKVLCKVSKWAYLTQFSQWQWANSHTLKCTATASLVSQEMLSLVYVTGKCSLRCVFQWRSWNNLEKIDSLVVRTCCRFLQYYSCSVQLTINPTAFTACSINNCALLTSDLNQAFKQVPCMLILSEVLPSRGAPSHSNTDLRDRWSVINKQPES